MAKAITSYTKCDDSLYMFSSFRGSLRPRNLFDVGGDDCSGASLFYSASAFIGETHPKSIRSLRSQRRTGSALAQELTRGMTSRSLSPRYRARLGPVHARRPLCLLGCASSVASLVSAEYPSTKQLLTFFRLRVTPTEETQRDAEVPTRQMQYSCNPAHRCPARGARNVCRASLRLPSDVKGLFPAGASLEQRRAAAL